MGMVPVIPQPVDPQKALLWDAGILEMNLKNAPPGIKILVKVEAQLLLAGSSKVSNLIGSAASCGHQVLVVNLLCYLKTLV